MHQCTHCQADLPDNAQFCTHCGTFTEQSQTLSTNTDEADTPVDEVTSKHLAVAASATPALPTLRTRRMHPQSSIPPFPSDPWLPPGNTEEEDHAIDTPSAESEEASAVTQLPLTPPVETISNEALQTPEGSDEPENAEPTLLAQGETQVQPTVDEIDTVSLPITTPEEIPASPADDQMPAPTLATSEPDEASTAPAGDLTQIPDEVDTSPESEPPLSPLTAPEPPPVFADDDLTTPQVSPAPTQEKPSTPPPASTEAQLPPISSGKRARAGRSRTLLVTLIVVLLVLAGGVGAVVLLTRHTSTGANAQCTAQQTNCTGNAAHIHGQPTKLAFSGAVAGPMSIVAKPSCQNATSGNLRILTVNLSGMVNNQLYNFGFVIEHYNGSGTYSNSTPSITVLFDVPGQSTTNGWSNSDPTDTGSISVDRGEQTGSISYTLSGVGTNAKTQIQISGNWTCGN